MSLTAAFMAGRYSMYRSLIGKGTNPMPIITFKTQQYAHATAVVLFVRNWLPVVAKQSADKCAGHRARHMVLWSSSTPPLVGAFNAACLRLLRDTVRKAPLSLLYDLH
ncbi:hypothetical protein EDB19DRAFT_1701338 [Suillus lakei]|nr:hypothetical protein EDB19DRAFT_1701338 [Suillus lakei]